MTYELVVVELALLRLPPGPTLEERQLAPHVRRMARSLVDPDVGELAPPVVDGNTMEVLDGGDRVAAHAFMGHTHVEVSLKRPTRRGRQKLLLAGNAERRHEPERQRRELVRLYELALADQAAANQAPRMAAHAQAIGRGRPRTPHGQAVREVAKQTGKRPDTVRKAIERHKQRTEGIAAAPIYDHELLAREFYDATWALDCLGEEPDEVTEVKATILKRYIWQAQLFLSRAAGAVRSALETEYGLRERHIAAWLHDVAVLRARLEELAPAVLCVSCRGSGCMHCSGRGWLDGTEG